MDTNLAGCIFLVAAGPVGFGLSEYLLHLTRHTSAGHRLTSRLARTEEVAVNILRREQAVKTMARCRRGGTGKRPRRRPWRPGGEPPQGSAQTGGHGDQGEGRPREAPKFFWSLAHPEGKKLK